MNISTQLYWLILFIFLTINYTFIAQADRHTNWQKIGFPDGSGSISIPSGWRLNSAQNTSAELQGPNGEAVAVGITMPIGPSQFAMQGVLASPYLMPADAYSFISEFIANKVGQTAQVRIIEQNVTQALTQYGNAAYLLADQITVGKQYRSFALVNTADLGNGYWQYYMTLLTAPKKEFEKALPVMIEIWESWSMSQGEMNRRTAQALQTMKETNQIMQSTAEGRRTSEWHQKLTGMTLQGHWIIENNNTKERREVTMEQMNSIMEAEPGVWRTLSSFEIKP
ncbi:MAG: hypothetical protein WAR79_00570 [Melioribacteraceae bacterium]